MGNWANHHGKSTLKGRLKHKEKERREIQNSQKTEDKMALVSLHTSKIILNVSGLTSPTKRQSDQMDIFKRYKYILSSRD